MWEDYDCSIEVTTHGMKEIRRGFEAEAVRRIPDNSPVPVKDRPERGVGMSGETNIAEKEVSSRNDLDTETEHILHFNAPTLEENDALADHRLHRLHRLHRDHTGEGIASKASVLGGVAPSTLPTDFNVWCAQAQQETERTLHQGKDMTVSDRNHSSEEPGEIIDHLIVSVKAPQTVKAIKDVAHRLTQNSSILFLQNGMGVVAEVNEKVFPDEKNRPTYIVGVVSHGLYSKRPFSIVHAGEGTIALGVQPRISMGEIVQPEALNQLSNSARYLMRTMTRTAVFVAVGFPPTDLLQQQLDKLAVNCIINPLTAILDCKNGSLLYNFYLTRVIRLLLAEISLVMKSLPELKNVPNVNMRFDTLRLERLVSSIANTTAENYSSMVQDVRSGRLTEIDYINGYIVKRGEEMGIHCIMNYMLMHMVKGKNKNTSQEKADLLPLASRRS